MRPPLHVCIITSAHPVDDVRVNHKIGQAFCSEGFRVTWLGPERAFFDPDHYDRYGIQYRLFRPGKGKVGRLLGGLNVYLHGLAVRDVQVFYAPDPDSAMVAVCLAHKQKANVIFDVHEMYHAGMLDRWVKGPAAKVAKAVLLRGLSKMCSKCDLVMGVSHAVLAPYWAVPVDKMVVRNCAPSWFAQEQGLNTCDSKKTTFTIMHGKADLSRGTGVVLNALSLARKQVPDLRCIMIDTFSEPQRRSGADEFHRQVAALDLQDIVEVRQGVPMHDMPAVLRACDIGLIAYGRTMGVDSLPNKLFEYMAVGLPIIAPSYSLEIGRILDVEKCGLTVDFEEPEAVAEAIVKLYLDMPTCHDMGRRARNAFELRHNWEVEVRPLLDRIQSWYPLSG